MLHVHWLPSQHKLYSILRCSIKCLGRTKYHMLSCWLHNLLLGLNTYTKRAHLHPQRTQFHGHSIGNSQFYFSAPCGSPYVMANDPLPTKFGLHVRWTVMLLVQPRVVGGGVDTNTAVPHHIHVGVASTPPPSPPKRLQRYTTHHFMYTIQPYGPDALLCRCYQCYGAPVLTAFVDKLKHTISIYHDSSSPSGTSLWPWSRVEVRLASSPFSLHCILPRGRRSARSYAPWLVSCAKTKE